MKKKEVLNLKDIVSIKKEMFEAKLKMPSLEEGKKIENIKIMRKMKKTLAYYFLSVNKDVN